MCEKMSEIVGDDGGKKDLEMSENAPLNVIQINFNARPLWSV